MRTIPVGSRALLVPVEDAAHARALADWVRDHAEAEPSVPAPTDVVPAACTLLLDGLHTRRAVDAWRDAIEGLDVRRLEGGRAGHRDGPGPATPSDITTIEVDYDGPDLDVVGEAWGCDRDEVVRRHEGATFEVAFCGFAPGFAYCVSKPPLPTVPRRASPRARVPAGSVALGGEFSAVYPAQMPGGWQLIGRTRTEVFDPALAQPALLMPGRLVRFRSLR